VAGVTFSDSDSAPVLKFWNPNPGRNFFTCEDPTTVQTLATIGRTEIQQCLKDHADPCYCRKQTVNSGPVFQKYLTPDLGPNKRRILPESTPAVWIRGHLCYKPGAFHVTLTRVRVSFDKHKIFKMLECYMFLAVVMVVILKRFFV